MLGLSNLTSKTCVRVFKMGYWLNRPSGVSNAEIDCRETIGHEYHFADLV